MFIFFKNFVFSMEFFYCCVAASLYFELIWAIRLSAATFVAP
jgi:hypothetical protein